MSLPTSMKALVIEADHLTLKEVPLPPLNDNHVLIKNVAIAANPTDWKHIDYNIGPKGSICGCDAAGVIVKLGANVDSSKYKVGQKVYGVVHGSSVTYPKNGAFAEYSTLDPQVMYVPNQDIEVSGKDTIPAGPVKYFEDVATFPVSLTTAGNVLYYNFGLDLVWEPAKPQRDHPILFWGGATAVGQPFIQLAKKLHGYTKIIAVASKKHEAKLKSYGADEVFDYHDADVIEQIKKKYPDIQTLVDCVSNEDTIQQVYKVASDDKPARILHLTTLSIDNIPVSERRENKKIETSLLYLAGGYDVPFGPVTIPADLEYRKHAIEFMKFINPYVNAGEIEHIPVKVHKGGLNDVSQMVDDIRKGRNSGQKLVAIL
ncbi:hypothetical protein RNJ44_04378 [Nakaseomyces bracarensis]|uniref:Enoyl reductase (ER) domain-containing protein n=1 Tax=Nakaseomyces bracarensis TaxID=273131 RepID=A0ABR4NUQ4_9SACH